MLLVVRRAGDAGNNSEHRAESVVYAVNRVCDPTAAAPVPAFAFENCVERRAWAKLRGQIVQHSRVRFFFERALAQKILHVGFARENVVALMAKFRFMSIFGRFHAPDRDLRTGGAIEPAFDPRTERIGSCRNWLAEIR